MVKGMKRSMEIQMEAYVRFLIIIVSPASLVKSAHFFDLKIFDEDIVVLDSWVLDFSKILSKHITRLTEFLKETLFLGTVQLIRM